MKTPAWKTPAAVSDGFMLIECLVYGFLTVALIGVAFMAFYRCVDSSLTLRRNADDIANALLAGEHWRDDIRAASGRIELARGADNETLILGSANQAVAYQFATNAVWRRTGEGNWYCAITNVKSSTMFADSRAGVSGWRWELELSPRAKSAGRFRALFTFLAVPERSVAR